MSFQSRSRRLVRQTGKNVLASSLYATALHQFDKLLGRRFPVAPSTSGHTLLLAPSGGGNIGDQAMFDMILATAQGPIVALVSHGDALRLRDADRRRVTLVTVPHLLKTPPPVRGADIRRFLRALDGAARFWIPGADTMDGGHPSASLARFSLARLAAAQGVPTTILGFSWSDDAPRSVVRAARNAAREGVRLIARDPLSHRRLVSSGVTPVVDAADIVFDYGTLEDLPNAVTQWLDASDQPVAIVNVSGMVGRKFSAQGTEYDLVFRELHERGLRILVLPHVLRDWDDDLQASSAVFRRYAATTDHLVTEQLWPAQVKALVQHADIVVTGRMHLAIMSMTHSVPVVTVATAGKVEGLYEMMGLTDGVVQPRPGMGDAIVSVLRSWLDQRNVVIDQLTRVRPEVVRRSRLNFPESA